MDQVAIEKAAVSLSNAQTARDDLDPCTSFKRFQELWYTFLFSSNGVYTVLGKGAKSSPQSRQWFGGQKNYRTQDPLLQYLAQARDDDEHGLGQVVEHDQTIVNVMIDTPEYKGPLSVRATYKRGKPE